MPDVLMIQEELGEDAELLLEPDEVLDNERLVIQQRMSLMAAELDRILAARRIKNQLQEANMVAVRHVEKDENGQPRDVVITIRPLPAALDALEEDCKDPTIPTDVSDENAKQQMRTWAQDGYDVEASNRLRHSKKDRSLGA